MKCPHCAGTGCNKRLPRMTAGMWNACDKCRGSGYDLKKCGVGPHVPVPLIGECRCSTPGGAR